MADRVDPSKNCQSLSGKRFRSCEIYTEECNAQQAKNPPAQSYVLVEPNGRKQTMTNAAQCFRQSVAIPRQRGPLPDARLAQPAAAKPPPPPAPPPAPPPDPASICARSSTPESCKEIARLCIAAGPSGPVTIETDRGTFKAEDQQSCYRLASSLGFRLTDAARARAAQRPPQPATPPPTPAAPPSESPPTAEKSAPAGASPPPADDTAAACGGSAPCQQLAARCTTGTTILRTDRGSFKADDQPSCIALASRLAGMGFRAASDAASSAGNPNAPSPPPNASTSASAAASSSGPAEDGTRHVRSFSDLRIRRLSVSSEEPAELRRLLLFPGPKGIPVTLRYTMAKTAENRYRMTYTILNNGSPIGGQQTLEFSTAGGEIQLGFEVTLASANAFGNVRAIRVIPLG